LLIRYLRSGASDLLRGVKLPGLLEKLLIEVGGKRREGRRRACVWNVIYAAASKHAWIAKESALRPSHKSVSNFGL